MSIISINWLIILLLNILIGFRWSIFIDWACWAYLKFKNVGFLSRGVRTSHWSSISKNSWNPYKTNKTEMIDNVITVINGTQSTLVGVSAFTSKNFLCQRKLVFLTVVYINNLFNLYLNFSQFLKTDGQFFIFCWVSAKAQGQIIHMVR